MGIYWSNHHHLFLTVKHINGRTLWANLHLLFWLSLFPFVSGWVGETHFEALPMDAYAAVALMCALAYTLLVRNLIHVDASNHLLAEAVGDDFKGNISIAAYILAIAAPFFGRAGVIVTGLLLIAVALMWLVPDRRIERVLARDEA